MYFALLKLLMQSVCSEQVCASRPVHAPVIAPDGGRFQQPKNTGFAWTLFWNAT